MPIISGYDQDGKFQEWTVPEPCPLLYFWLGIESDKEWRIIDATDYTLIDYANWCAATRERS